MSSFYLASFLYNSYEYTTGVSCFYRYESLIKRDDYTNIILLLLIINPMDYTLGLIKNLIST